MKKIILIISAAVGISTGAFAQGSLILQSQSTPGGVSATTTNINTSSWFTGTLSLQVFAVSSNLTTVADIAGINSSWNNPVAAAALLISDGFISQTIGGSASVNASVTGGSFSLGTVTIGSSGTITTGNNYIYAIVGSVGSTEGVLAFAPSGSGSPSPGTPINDATIWPNQNLYLAPVPEPTTLALAGLGGAALLAIRRRKA